MHISLHLPSPTPGKQSIPASGPSTLTRGQSVTDACINWNTTVAALDKLREAVQARRSASGTTKPQRQSIIKANGSHDAPPTKKGFNDDAIALFSKK